MNNTKELYKKALIITLLTVLAYIIFSHISVNISYNLYNSQFFKGALLYIDCVSSEYYSKCLSTYNELLNDLYSNKSYYIINETKILPGLLLTALSALSLYCIIPIVLFASLVKYIIIQLWLTNFGNFIFVGLVILLLFCAIYLYLMRLSNRHLDNQLIFPNYDLENNIIQVN
ncbi:hypothetical protein Catovirus_1_1028 [Catovirus CTV1]|uniref:Transmembrane protein n=1 Tax=Catovirus CTV1 TaxID=1977631 RepID=A0A1V0SBE5_9VIRU|nr:hypothetical protein Catovirus_1_1028 [Catovirus CTV1]